MKKILVAMMIMALAVPFLHAGEESEECKALNEQIKAATKDLGTLKSTVLKDLKDDAKLKELGEKRKAIQTQMKELEQECDKYLCEKKPEIADAIKKVDDLKAKLDEAKKAAKAKEHPEHPEKGKKEKKNE